MAAPVEPVAGKFAVFIFFLGTFSAGLSSVFPCMLIAPIHLADYQSGELDTISKQFRIGTFLVALVALLEPILGSNPIQFQILSQVFNAFVLPLVVLGIIIMISNNDVMKDHVTGIGVQLGLYGAMFFSLVISYNGVVGIIEKYF